MSPGVPLLRMKEAALQSPFSLQAVWNVLLFISPPPWLMPVGPRCQTVKHNCLLMVTSGSLASFFPSFFSPSEQMIA